MNNQAVKLLKTAIFIGLKYAQVEIGLGGVGVGVGDNNSGN